MVPTREDLVRWADALFTAAENKQMAREGWGLFDTGDRLEIERDDEAEQFDYDEDVIEFVTQKARKGSRMHQKALLVHTLFTGDF